VANLTTYQDIENAIYDRFDDSSAETVVTVRREITATLRRIWSMPINWKFAKSTGTINTVDTTTNYSLASDFGYGRLYDVINTTSKVRMSYWPDRDLDSSQPAYSTTGSPYAYKIWGSTSGTQDIQPYPIPDGVYVITYKYYRLPVIVDLETVSTQPANDALEPDLPTEFRELLVLNPLIELYKKDANPLANVTQIQFDNLIAQMQQRYSDEPDILHVMKSEDDNVNMTGPNLTMPANFGPNVD
jgi:hypothetical protein